jgi:hypothetical protein
VRTLPFTYVICFLTNKLHNFLTNTKYKAVNFEMPPKITIVRK